MKIGFAFLGFALFLTSCATSGQHVCGPPVENPLIGVWSRISIENTKPVTEHPGLPHRDEGQLFVVRSDGNAVLQQGHPLPLAPQPYVVDCEAKTIVFKKVTFHYTIKKHSRATPPFNPTILTLVSHRDDNTVTQRYVLITDSL